MCHPVTIKNSSLSSPTPTRHPSPRLMIYNGDLSILWSLLFRPLCSHNDLPWNIRKFLKNQLREFRFGENLKEIAPFATSSWSHTDLRRLKEGMVGAQVCTTTTLGDEWQISDLGIEKVDHKSCHYYWSYLNGDLWIHSRQGRGGRWRTAMSH